MIAREKSWCENPSLHRPVPPLYTPPPSTVNNNRVPFFSVEDAAHDGINGDIATQKGKTPYKAHLYDKSSDATTELRLHVP